MKCEFFRENENPKIGKICAENLAPASWTCARTRGQDPQPQPQPQPRPQPPLYRERTPAGRGEETTKPKGVIHERSS